MVIDKKILDELTAKAKENPRLRCNLDMRNSADGHHRYGDGWGSAEYREGPVA